MLVGVFYYLFFFYFVSLDFVNEILLMFMKIVEKCDDFMIGILFWVQENLIGVSDVGDVWFCVLCVVVVVVGFVYYDLYFMFLFMYFVLDGVCFL